jgi:hypothetical protein
MRVEDQSCVTSTKKSCAHEWEHKLPKDSDQIFEKDIDLSKLNVEDSTSETMAKLKAWGRPQIIMDTSGMFQS